MARWWTIKIPPTLVDVTDDPANVAFKTKLEQMRRQAADVDGHIYANDDGGLVVIDSAFSDMPQKLSVISGFEEGARKSSYGTGRELTYEPSRNDTFVMGTQHTIGSRDVEGWHMRWTGAGTDGKLHNLGISCSLGEAKCKEVLASVTTDPSSFKTLASLGGDVEDSQAFRIGQAVGGGLVLILVIAILIKARRRSRTSR